MYLRLLGTGSPAPLAERQCSALVLSYGNDHLLFDAGRGVTTQLVRANIAPHELSAIFLTHHHYDHIGNLGDLLLTAWHGGSSSLPLVGPPGTAEIVQALFTQVYQREILFSHTLAHAVGEPMLDIQQVVRVTDIAALQTYQHKEWRIHTAAVEHGHQLGLTQAQWPCLGYRVEVADRSIVISGDTIACDNLIALADHADVLVQCCHYADAQLTTPARQLLAKTVIATSGQVGKIAAQAHVNTLVLTHFGVMSPDMRDAIIADVRRDFAGALYLGEDLLTLEI